MLISTFQSCMKNIKRIFLYTVISILVQNAYSITIQLTAPADIKTTFALANDGDIIELTTSGGAYTWSAKATVSNDKSITVRAAAGLAVRPIILWSGATPAATNYFVQYSPAGTSTKTMTFDGIEFDGANKVGALFLGKCTGTSNLIVLINNCVIRNILAGSQVCLYSAIVGSTIYGDLTVQNTEFRNFGSTVISPTGTTASPNNVSFINCLFVGPTTGILTTAAVKMAVSNYNSITLDHCTFNGLNIAEFFTKSSLGVSSIKNTIFANSTNATNTQLNQFGSTPNFINLGSDCGIYYTAAGTLGTIYPSLRTSAVSKWTDPVLDSDGFATATPYLTGSTDGKPIGYYNTNASAPKITSSVASITELGYNGTAASVEKSFSINAVNLTSYLIIQPPTNFEISLSSGASFGTAAIHLTPTNGTVSATTVFVRLAEGLAVNSYTGNITLSSTWLSSKTISLTGEVTVPTITTDMTSMPDFNYVSGASELVPIQVSALNLLSDIQISAAPGYELSLDGTTGFVSALLLSAQTNGDIAPVSVYVRMTNGLARGHYSGNISLTSTGAKTILVAVNGQVTPTPVISISDLTGFDYILDKGPSYEQTVSVCGSGLSSDILITSTADYEISLESGISFTGTNSISLSPTNAEVPLTKIYLRLKSGLSVAHYTGNLVLNSIGTSEQKILLSGQVSSFANAPQRIKNVNQAQTISLKIVGNNTEKKVQIFKVIVQ